MARHQRASDAEDRITVARLDGAARRLLDAQATGEEAVAELRRITHEPQLLARAGGVALGCWRTNQTGDPAGRDVARLMVHAGADEQLLQQVADETAARMPQRRAYGS